MKVYELASQMGVLSGDISRLATEQGYGRLGPADDLTAAQEQVLRQLLAAPSLGSAEPMPWRPPTSPPDPQVAQPSPPPHLPPPVAPPDPNLSGWAPPPPAPPDPNLSGWAPPPPPDAPSWGGQEPSAPPPPPWSANPEPPSGPGAGSPPPPPPLRPPPPEQAAPPPPAPRSATPTIDDPIPSGGGAGFDRTQVLMVGGAVAVAVALFIYMAVNMGGDPPRPVATSATPPGTSTSAGSVTTATVASPTSTATTTPAPPVTAEEASPTTVIHRHEMRDTGRYCAGSRLILPLEMRIGAAAAEADWLGVQEAVRSGRASWEQGVADMLAGSSPALEDDVVAYRDSYTDLFDAVIEAPSTTALISVFAEYDLASIQGAAGSINWAIGKHCT